MTGASRARPGDRPCIPYVGRTGGPRDTPPGDMGGSGASQSARIPRTGVQASQGLLLSAPGRHLASEELEEEFGAVLPLPHDGGMALTMEA